MNRNQSSLWWGGLLILLGGAFLLESLGVFHIMGRFVWMVVLVGISLPFWLVYLSGRDQWWALIPGCVLAGVGVGVLMGGALTAIIINGSISLAFWLIYLADRQNWWALIPGWTMACVTAIILLGCIGLDWLIAPFVMFAIAAPFLLVYLLNPDQWWALIPGGIMAAIGVLLLAGVIMSSFSFWPIILILAGIWFIYRAFQPRPAAPASHSSQGVQSPRMQGVQSPRMQGVSQFEEPETPAPAAQPDEPR